MITKLSCPGICFVFYAALQTGKQPPAEESAVEAPAAESEGNEPEEASSKEEPAEQVPAGENAVDEPGEEVPAEDIPEDESAEDEDPDEDPAEEETDAEPGKTRVTVTVEISMIDESVMRLFAVVDDPEGRDFLYQWQVSEDSGETYMDIPEATTEELKVELTDENINNMWRVRVQSI